MIYDTHLFYFRFVSAGPDQRRTEQSDASGHVRGSYTFIDDKGTQHTVHYIAGPETGYRVLKNVKGPHFPNWYPFGLGRPGFPVPDFADDYADKNIEDIFSDPKEHLNTAASGHVKPPKSSFGSRGGVSSTRGEDGGGRVSSFDKDDDSSSFDDDSFGGKFGKGSAPKKPSFYTPPVTRKPFGNKKPFLDDDGGYSGSEDNFGDDLFKPSASGDSSNPSRNYKTTEKPNGRGSSTRLTTQSSVLEDDSTKSFNDDYDLFGGGSPSGGRGTGGSSGSRGGEGGGGDGSGGNRPDGKGSSGGHKSTSPSSSFGSRGDFNKDQGGDQEPVRIGATFDGKSTILKNIGDKFISLSPGIAVRAHVQSIDILPFGSRLPSPSEQLKAESSNIEEQEHAEISE